MKFEIEIPDREFNKLKEFFINDEGVDENISDENIIRDLFYLPETDIDLRKNVKVKRLE